MEQQPNEIISHILSFANDKDTIPLRTVNKKWKNLINNRLDDDKILKVEFTKCGDLHNSFARLNNISKKCTVEFIAPIDQNDSENTNENLSLGKIIFYSNENNVLAKIIINGKIFKFIRCTEPRISVDISVKELYNFFKIIKDEHVVILEINANDKKKLHLTKCPETYVSKSHEFQLLVQKEIKLINQNKPKIDSSKIDFKHDLTDDILNFKIKYDDIITFKKFFSFTNDILPNLSMEFSPPKTATSKDTGGVRIIRLTEDKTVLIKMNIYAANFEEFKCSKKFSISACTFDLNGCFKNINNKCRSVMAYINKNNENILNVETINNQGSKTHCQIPITYNDLPDISLPATEFDCKSIINSKDFIDMCQYYKSISSYLNFIYKKNILTIQDKKSDNNDNNLNKFKYNCASNSNSEDVYINTYYEYRYLLSLSKCIDTCENIEIYLKNNFPLVIKISIGNLGVMYFFLTELNDVSS
jgi:proliferating cell nuclear antigen